MHPRSMFFFRNGPLEAPKLRPDASQASLEAPLTLKIIGFTPVNAHSHLRASTSFLHSRGAPGEAQRLPKGVGRGAQRVQVALGRLQKAPKTPSKRRADPPREPPGAPRGAQEHPKRRPGGPWMALGRRPVPRWTRGPFRRPFLDDFWTILIDF